LLRAHIQKEDEILYPMADRMLSAEDVAALQHKFEVVEAEHMGEGTHERYLQLALELAKQYGVEHGKIKSLLHDGAHCCSHSH
jgi:hemerythrin-like domain-containing protein